MSRFLRIAMVAVAMLLVSFGGVDGLTAQEEESESLRLSLRRNFGYSLGAQMQGTFTYKVSGPADLVRVEFLLDDQVIGEDTEAPFELGFNTRNYGEGLHRLSAVGYSAGGEPIRSNSISRQFVATSAVTIAVLAVVVIALAFRVISYWLARRSGGGSRGRVDYGFLGGAICPKCGRSFGIHWWSLRLGLGRFDRCPHCGKWSMVQRASTDTLMAAEETRGAYRDGEARTSESEREKESLRRRIEDSRFDE